MYGLNPLSPIEGSARTWSWDVPAQCTEGVGGVMRTLFSAQRSFAIGLLAVGTLLSLLWVLSLLPSEDPRETVTMQPIAREIDLPANYQIVDQLNSTGDTVIQLTVTRTVLTVDESAITSWCGGCSFDTELLPSGHLMVFPTVGCVTFTIPEMAPAMTTHQEFMVSAILVTNQYIIQGNGKGTISNVCQAAFWLGEFSRG